MLTKSFGIEIEMRGITRREAAYLTQGLLGGTVEHRQSYDSWVVIAPDGREWKFVRDVSINAYSEKQTEFVSPICFYDNDMETIQEIVRTLKRHGANTDESCGIHIHIDGADHTAKTIKNFINIMTAKNDLLYGALAIPTRRQIQWCKKLDSNLSQRVNKLNKPTLEKIEDIWYEEFYDGNRGSHYHRSRYHFLNLHSFFHGHGTIELRGFNSTLHAGKVRAYVVLALALNNQALTQKSASNKEAPNNKQLTRMSNYLERIGVTGEEFENCAKHLTAPLRKRGQSRVAI